MTVGKMTAACWVLFGVMSFGFLPLLLGVFSLHALPGPARTVLAVFVVAVLWWGPFVYGMYLAQAVMGSGDRRLLKRGRRGTAVVLKAEMTGMTLGGAPDMGILGRRVYRYQLRVTASGKDPYETYCSIAYSHISQGQTVKVAVSPHNRKRVTIDVGQDRVKLGKARPTAFSGSEFSGSEFSPVDSGTPHDRSSARSSSSSSSASVSAGSERIHQLTELGKLHREGVLTDAEFAAEKARILKQ
ncbi:hypothetical protein ABIA33_003713 [Streptacidiphilus sp. MAP12-16]|uniref:SHOCT domain-containing protein n=1 Tax=Streptacidiphilus sp. MAP12-16 TaxID=3156300 RepID=UPI003513B7FE